MGFLNNSGDIILDVVLTDHGRKELARGDGSFKITKFALGDEEINYARYNKDHANGSSFYALEILQTPILEAFTDNAASMKTKLVTYENLDLLFLPVLKLNEIKNDTKRNSVKNAFIIAVDRATEDDDEGSTTKGIGIDSSKNEVQGVLFGESLDRGATIVVDQGLDTDQISARSTIDPDLNETEYTIQIDGRLGTIHGPNGEILDEAYTDDDGISYYVVSQGDPGFEDIQNLNKNVESPVAGPRGSRLRLRIGSSMDLQTSTFLFTKLGGTDTMANRGGTTSNVLFIDSVVRISGNNLGSTLDLPVRFVKVQ